MTSDFKRVNLGDRVKNALLRPDLSYREVEFSQLQSRIREQLLQVYDLEGDRWAISINKFSRLKNNT
ncbi:hypothetical protein IQ276_003900 [Desmonostoc muscorum LEGE 12446]|nr:hypothetical protein [Desmonostoc muscorum]MCF2145612.1 hypothetical protein [Desmonostoc muscorum LEGE 12446]